MDKILEKFGGYLIDKYKGKTMFGLPVMNYVFRFENGYGAWMEIWDNFSIFSKSMHHDAWTGDAASFFIGRVQRSAW